jgi:hypothetical protein
LSLNFQDYPRDDLNDVFPDEVYSGPGGGNLPFALFAATFDATPFPIFTKRMISP